MEKLLFLPSTPLNVLISCAMALQKKPHTQMEIWLVDQKKVEDNPYYKALKTWSDSPFSEVKVFSGQAKGLRKVAERRQNFALIKTELNRFKPNSIAVGSDRRIEFQYAMHLLSAMDIAATGIYLDDGLYSYSGRKQELFNDMLSTWLKKLIYGFWWQEPKTVGASAWIDQAWLFQPTMAVEALQQKRVMPINVDWFKSEALLDFSSSLARVLNVSIDKVNQIDFLLLIPHPNNITKIPDYELRVKKLVRQQVTLGKKVGVKYHPRMDSEDALNLRASGVYDILHSSMAFEFCLPMLSSTCVVVGDIGTALFTTKWLRPEIEVKAVLDENNTFQNSFISLTRNMGIEVISISEVDNL